MKKEFDLAKKDGTKAKVTFAKRDNIWFWDLPEHLREVLPGMVPSLPLPDVNLDQAKTLKNCLDLVAHKRGNIWVGQVIADLVKEETK